QRAVAFGREGAFHTDIDEIVVVVADDGDESAGRYALHKLLRILIIRKSGGRRHRSAAERNFAVSFYVYLLAFFYDPAGIRPTVRGFVRQNFYVQRDRFAVRAAIGVRGLCGRWFRGQSRFRRCRVAVLGVDIFLDTFVRSFRRSIG